MIRRPRVHEDRGRKERERDREPGRQFYPGSHGFDDTTRAGAERESAGSGSDPEPSDPRPPAQGQYEQDHSGEDRQAGARGSGGDQQGAYEAGRRGSGQDQQGPYEGGLEGTVPDRHMKHAIEDLVDACPGAQDIDNRIRVRPAENPPPGVASSGGTS